MLFRVEADFSVQPSSKIVVAPTSISKSIVPASVFVPEIHNGRGNEAVVETGLAPQQAELFSRTVGCSKS